MKLTIKELVKFIKKHAPSVITAGIILLILFGGSFGLLYKFFEKRFDDLYKKNDILLKEKSEFEKYKTTEGTNLKQREKENREHYESNLKKEKELLKLESQLKDKQKIIDAEMQLNKYIDMYNAEFSDIDLNKEYACDNEYMKRYRKAENILDTIGIKAKEAGKEKLYNDFIVKKKSGIHAVTGCPPKLRKLDFNQETK